MRRTWVATGLAALLTGLVPAVAPAGATAGSRAGAGPQVVAGTGRAVASPPTTASCLAAFGVRCYRPGQIRAAYDVGPLATAGVDGKGVTIAVVDSFGSPTIASDLAEFDTAFGLPAPPSFSVIAPAGAIPPYDPKSSVMAGWAAETTLDVEWAHAMAPGAGIVVVETPVAETIGLQGIPKMVEAENYVVNHHLAQVISQSWAAAEATFTRKAQILAQRSAFVNAAAHGVTVVAASGDQGPTSASNAAATKWFTSRKANWPATDPLVTAVGGTKLTLSSTGARLAPDQVWDDRGGAEPAASGGGLSTVFPRPAWQASVASVVGAHRGVPDISLSAASSDSVLIAFKGEWLPIAGTSEAAPLFAGIVALADQEAGHGLGLINPTLYRLAAAHAPGIVPVKLGNTTVSFFQGGRNVTVPGWRAVSGYNLATGLGTVDAAKFVPELVGAPRSSV